MQQRRQRRGLVRQLLRKHRILRSQRVLGLLDEAFCDVELRIDIANGLPNVRVDAGMMQQALLNIALNACQAMPGGGRLRLGASSASGKRVEIVCEDTGPGIKPEHLDRIFDLYFTTKDSGSGIGLSMVYRAVQLHDGEIQVQSTLGRGATFRIWLPQASA